MVHIYIYYIDMGMRTLILNYNVFYVFYLYTILKKHFKKLYMFNEKLLVKII